MLYDLYHLVTHHNIHNLYSLIFLLQYLKSYNLINFNIPNCLLNMGLIEILPFKLWFIEILLFKSGFIEILPTQQKENHSKHLSFSSIKNLSDKHTPELHTELVRILKLNEEVVMNVRNFYTYAEKKLGAVSCSLYCVQAVHCHLVGIKFWFNQKKVIKFNLPCFVLLVFQCTLPGEQTSMYYVYGNCNVASNSWSSIWFIIMQWLESEEALDPLFWLQKDCIMCRE